MTAAQATPPAPTIDLSFAPNPTTANDVSTLTVTVSPGLAGESVVVETKLLGLLWSPVTSTANTTGSPQPLGDDGATVQYLVKQGLNGNYQYRAKVSANASHTAGTSAVETLSVVAASTPTTQPGVYTCGSATPSVPHPGGGSWSCMYNDEFDSTTLGPFWSISQQGYMTQPKTEKACFGNEATHNVTLDGQYLELSATVYGTPQNCPGSGHPTAKSRKFGALLFHNDDHGTEPTLQQTYGYWEVNAKLPDAHGDEDGWSVDGYKPKVGDPLPPNYDATQGLQETFYLWPTTDRYGFWPFSGELDFAEFYSAAGNVVSPAVHDGLDNYQGGWGNQHCNIRASTGGHPGDFNTYKFLWSTSELTMWVNDDTTPCLTVPVDGKPFDKGFFLALIQAFGTSSTLNEYELPPAGTPTTMQTVGTTYVDYVRVWQ